MSNAPTDNASLVAEVEHLRTEVRALRGLLHGQTVPLRSPAMGGMSAPPISPSNQSSESVFSLDAKTAPVSVPPAIVTTHITASEIQAMKAIFDVFDEDRDGLISVSDLAQL